MADNIDKIKQDSSPASEARHNTDNVDTLSPHIVLQLKLMKRAGTESGPMWFGLPERWWDNPHWRCCNDHVSRRYLKGEAKGYNACLDCYEPVFLTFPEDADGPLT